jgi:hypothetical protein
MHWTTLKPVGNHSLVKVNQFDFFIIINSEDKSFNLSQSIPDILGSMPSIEQDLEENDFGSGLESINRPSKVEGISTNQISSKQDDELPHKY